MEVAQRECDGTRAYDSADRIGPNRLLIGERFPVSNKVKRGEYTRNVE